MNALQLGKERKCAREDEQDGITIHRELHKQDSEKSFTQVK